MLTACVPGKALLVGGYAILSPQARGIVLALDSYFHCRLRWKRSNQSSVKVFSRQIGRSWSYSLENNKMVGLQEKNNFIEATLDHFSREKGLFFQHKELEVEFEFQRLFASPFSQTGYVSPKIATYSPDYIKSGLGSSACLIVSLAKCLCELLNENIQPEELFNISEQINLQAQSGMGSSFDIASAIFGSHIFQKKQKPKRLQIDKKIKVNLVFGRSCSDSRVLSSKVKQYLQQHPLFQHDFIETNNLIVSQLIQALHHADLDLFRLANSRHLALLSQLAQITNQPILSPERLQIFKNLLTNPQVLYAVAPGAGGDDAFLVLTAGQGDSWTKSRLGPDWQVKTCGWV